MTKEAAIRSICRRLALTKAAQAQLDVAQMGQEARKRIAQETKGSTVGATTRFSPQLQQLIGRLQRAKGRRIAGYNSGSGFQYA